VKTHKFFEDFDFINLYRLKLIPPFIPELTNEVDHKYIDPGLEKEKAEDSQVNDLCVQMAKGKKQF
jgi:hypothetical protein